MEQGIRALMCHNCKKYSSIAGIARLRCRHCSSTDVTVGVVDSVHNVIDIFTRKTVHVWSCGDNAATSPKETK